MQKLRLAAIFLAVLLAAAPLQGVCQAEDNFTVQSIVTMSGVNYVGVLQGISGFPLPYFTDSGAISMNFSNVTVNGVYNRTIGIGSFRNLGSLAFINLMPNQDVAPVTFSGQMFSQGNQ